MDKLPHATTPNLHKFVRQTPLYSGVVASTVNCFGILTNSLLCC